METSNFCIFEQGEGARLHNYMLDRLLLPYVKRYHSMQFLFQHGGAATHSTAVTKEFPPDVRIEVREVPTGSPDQNLIENILGALARETY